MAAEEQKSLAGEYWNPVKKRKKRTPKRATNMT